MKNPFQYGDVVGGDAFCNRRKEVGDLLRAMENGEKRLWIKQKIWSMWASPAQGINYLSLMLIRMS